MFTLNSKINDVINDTDFGNYGRLIFPVDMNIDNNLELKDAASILPWYSEVNPEKTVEIVNYMKEKASNGEQIFYDIYTEEEKRNDAAKRNTGLFFFRGDKGAKSAVVNAGGGFVYVAAIHDSFPHALELSKKGYNAFALIYRPGAQTACEDLARAIAFLNEHANELQIDMTDYSLWGGSAGARMAAWLGSYGTAYFGEKQYPSPSAVIMQYTGLSQVTGNEPPTYRGFGGFSMGSVNTWNTFRYCLDYFRYFMPMSGSYTTDGGYMADLVREQGYNSDDFFIFSAAGTNDFAYSAFKAQITAMANNSGGMFKFAKNESDGNLSFLEREGYSHDGKACDEYTYNGLRFFWNGQTENNEKPESTAKKYNVEPGTEEYKGFMLDNVLHSENEGDIHYNLYVPQSYDGSKSYALFLTLPGYQGLYFQGVGENVRTEEFGFTARDYVPDMIIAAPQLNDWGDTSARQTIELTEYFLDTYNIDKSRVYAEGYSGGGETMSRVMGMRPELYTAYLQCSSRWNGGYEAVVKSRTPVYLAVGEKDEYYGAEPSRNAYSEIRRLYKDEGLSDSEVDKLVVLDVKPTSYFTQNGITNQHGYGGYLFVRDNGIMSWLFGQVKN